MQSPLNDPFPAIIIVGPTAVGKTDISLAIAEEHDAEIIGVDSMQVYKHMDVGTAKPTEEERRRAVHHLIDAVEPDEEFHLGRFVREALAALEGIRERGRLPLLVGGTGLYLKGLLEGVFESRISATAEKESRRMTAVRDELRKELAADGRDRLYDELRRSDPETADRLHPHDTQRLLRALEIHRATGVPWSAHLQQQGDPAPIQRKLRRHALKTGLTCPRTVLHERINRRVERMVEEGLLEEVRGLLAMGYGMELKPMRSIGYRHMCNYLAGRWSWEEALRLLARDTRRYAKRQYTWFRADPDILWFDAGRREDLLARVRSYLHSWRTGAVSSGPGSGS